MKKVYKIMNIILNKSRLIPYSIDVIKLRKNKNPKAKPYQTKLTRRLFFKI